MLQMHRRKRFIRGGLYVLLAWAVLWFVAPLWSLNGLLTGAVMHERWKGHGPSSRVKVEVENAAWVPGSRISQYFIYALISAEDSRFFNHAGIDWREIRLSIHKNIKHKQYVRGASTITQQVVKQVALSSEKTLLRKTREMLGALLVEHLMSKQNILSWYINLAHFGAGIYGIKEAAEYYFQTSAEHLSIAESIHLAMILPGPASWAHGLRRRSLTHFGKKRFLTLLQEMYNNGYITAKQYKHVKHTGDFGRPLHPSTIYLTQQ